MNESQLKVKAALIYLSLMFPPRERDSILSTLWPSLKEDRLKSPYMTIEFLDSNAKDIIETFENDIREFPDEDSIPEDALFLIIRVLFGDNKIDLVERFRLFATVLTLCEAFRTANKNDELAKTLQRAYDKYAQVTGSQPINFSSLGPNSLGSYIRVDCLREEATPQEEEEKFDGQAEDDLQAQLPEQTVGNDCHKFPRFSYMVKGQEKEYLTLLYNELSKVEDYRLFRPKSCTLDNFLSLFEGVHGYENRNPQPFEAAFAITYWGIFLSEIYSRKNKMLDDRKISRHDCSELAAMIIRDLHGNPITSSKTFDKSSGVNYIKGDELSEWEQKYTNALKKAKNAILPPSKVREILKGKNCNEENEELKNKKL